MSLMSSQFGPDDMEALFWGPSILTADPLPSLLDPDEMMASPSEEPSSPLSSLSSPSSQFSSLCPPSSPAPPLPDSKVGGDMLPLPWVAATPLNQAHMNSGDVKEDAFSGMDWMAETMDLSDFDLDSLISSCDPENTPSSPDDLVSSLDSVEPPPGPVLDAPAPTLDASTHTAVVPEVQTELEIKTEPPSPVPSPSVLPPASPASTLEFGSEVDVSEVKKSIPKETPQVTRIVLSLSPTRIVLLLTPPKQEVGIAQSSSCAVDLPNSGSGTSVSPKAFQANFSRTQPYPATGRTTRSKLSPEVAVVPAASGGSKGRSRVQEKKQRKMEQNKTAATRYRLKKRAQQESLHTECEQLEERNRELVEKADSITKEIQYLKELIEEVRVAKQRKVLADHNVQRDFISQTGDPTGTGRGGESVFCKLYGDQARFFDAEKVPRIKHKKKGTVSMVNNGNDQHGSQFLITTSESLDYLDGVHTVFGEVTEGMDVLKKINETFVDKDFVPYQDIRINHTVILDDPYDDPPNLPVPDRSPEPTKEQLDSGRIGADEAIDDNEGKSTAEMDEILKEKEAKTQAILLEMVGDLPDADIRPPENVLFVCKLNPVTTDEDLEIIFSRFGPISSCEIIRDWKTGESLCYAFIEFEKEEDCEKAYFKMDNVLIDDRRIHVDFSQSVAKIKWKGKGGKYTKDDFKAYEKDQDNKTKLALKDKAKPKQDSRYDLVLDEEEKEEGGSHQVFDRKQKERTHHHHRLDDEDVRKPKKSKESDESRRNKKSSRHHSRSRSRSRDRDSHHKHRDKHLDRHRDKHRHESSDKSRHHRSRSRSPRRPRDNKERR